MKLDPREPNGPIEQRWSNAKFEMKLVNPANKRKYKVIVVGSGLAGGAAAATLAELGYDVACFCFQDSPRRAHSIAAQGGINAAKNYQNDGDSVHRLFYDTVKGGDFRSRESNVHRLAEVSLDIIDQSTAMGVPFAREYGGTLANRSFGGAQVSRTFYARGQTGQQLLLGVYSAMSRQIGAGKIKMFPRTEMLDLVVDETTGRASGIVVRDLITGAISSHAAHAVILATGGYGNVFYLSTNAKGCNVTAAYRAYKRGAGFANPCFTQIHPTCIPVSGDYQSKLTLMSESLRNDGRVWVPLARDDIKKHPDEIAENNRDYYLERKYPAFGNLSPRDIASRAAKEQCDDGRGVGPGGRGVYLDFRDAIKRDGKDRIEERYGNLFEMYERITGEDPYRVPMRIYPAVHYAMGGLWVDYQLMTTVPGLFCLGEANFSDHGANRLGASALMQGLADGYFIIPYTLGNYLAGVPAASIADPGGAAFEDAEREVRAKLDRLVEVRGKRSIDSFHKELGHLLWEDCGMTRSKASLEHALAEIPKLRERFWADVTVLGDRDSFNQSLEKAGRVADFLEFGELMCRDALTREESCGGHFRVEHATPDGEAKRDDEHFCHAAVWEYAGEDPDPACRAARVRERQARDQELQVSDAQLESRVARVASGLARGHRQVRALPRQRRVDPRLVPGDARHPERAARRQGRRAGRVRSRLPRGHLRHVLADDQRPATWRAQDHDDLPAPHALLQVRRRDLDRAVARLGVPGDQGSVRRSDRVRSHHHEWRLRHRQRRFGARCQRHADRQGRRRGRDGRRRVYRLWRMRRRVPERLGHAVHRREAGAPPPSPAGPARAPSPHARDGRRDGRRGVRQLLEPLRVRGRVSEGHLAGHDRRAEPGLPEGHVLRRASVEQARLRDPLGLDPLELAVRDPQPHDPGPEHRDADRATDGRVQGGHE